ncbi:MAG: 2-amino-4-hydroxy-6-hydroxymethyldihydropteridine diphosphokinase [Paracoccaceae bacterium]
MTICLVAYGCNLESDDYDLASTIDRVLDVMSRTPGLRLRQTSQRYRTPAWPEGSGPDFLNGAISIETSFAPEDVLSLLHDIEAQLGRTRDQRWGPRTCDLDLIAVEQTILPDVTALRHWVDMDDVSARAEVPSELILPHPRMHRRAFVLVPLGDIAPDWRHPLLGRTVTEMISALPPGSLADVRAFED